VVIEAPKAEIDPAQEAPPSAVPPSAASAWGDMLEQAETIEK